MNDYARARDALLAVREIRGGEHLTCLLVDQLGDLHQHAAMVGTTLEAELFVLEQKRYDPGQLRDWRGRWARFRGTSPHAMAIPHVLGKDHISAIRRKGYGPTPEMLLVSTAFPDMDRYASPALGRLIVPTNISRVADTDNSGVPWAADNGFYSSGDTSKFVKMLDTFQALKVKHILWVTAPDAVGDWKQTAKQFEHWAPIIRQHGVPVALVAQEGLDSPEGLAWLDQHWDDFSALFIGGKHNAWKLGPGAAKLAQLAHEHGKLVHLGRVSSTRRMSAARDVIGADSVDGTTFAANKRVKLAPMLKYITGSPDAWVPPEKPGDVPDYKGPSPKGRQRMKTRYQLWRESAKHKALTTPTVAYDLVEDALGYVNINPYNDFGLIDEGLGGFWVRGPVSQLLLFSDVLGTYDPTANGWLDGGRLDGDKVEFADVQVSPSDSGTKSLEEMLDRLAVLEEHLLELKEWREDLHPRDSHGRFAHTRELVADLEATTTMKPSSRRRVEQVRTVVERPPEGVDEEPSRKTAVNKPSKNTSKWNALQQESITRALDDELKRHPNLSSGFQGLVGFGFGTGQPPHGIGIDDWRELRRNQREGESTGITGFVPGLGSLIQINDMEKMPTDLSATAVTDSYGVAIHELGHAYFNQNNFQPMGAASDLLEHFKIGPRDIFSLSMYGVSDPREALAEMYASEYGHGQKMTPALKAKFEKLLKAVEEKGSDLYYDVINPEHQAKHPDLYLEPSSLIGPDSPLWPKAMEAAKANLDANAWVASSPLMDQMVRKPAQKAFNPQQLRDWHGRWARMPGSRPSDIVGGVIMHADDYDTMREKFPPGSAFVVPTGKYQGRRVTIARYTRNKRTGAADAYVTDESGATFRLSPNIVLASQAIPEVKPKPEVRPKTAYELTGGLDDINGRALRSWTKGSTGSGIVYNGQVYAWRTDKVGSPGHVEVLRANSGTFGSNKHSGDVDRFVIGEDGQVLYWKAGETPRSAVPQEVLAASKDFYDPLVGRPKPPEPEKPKVDPDVQAIIDEIERTKSALGDLTDFHKLQDIGRMVDDAQTRRLATSLAEMDKAIQENKDRRVALDRQHDQVTARIAILRGAGKDVTEAYAEKDRIWDQMRALSKERGELETKRGQLTTNTLLDVLGQIRPLGGTIRAKGGTGGSAADRKRHADALAQAQRRMPKAWIDDMNAAGEVSFKIFRNRVRGWHNASPKFQTQQIYEKDYPSAEEFEKAVHAMAQEWGVVPSIRNPTQYAAESFGAKRSAWFSRPLGTDSTIKATRGDASLYFHELLHRVQVTRGAADKDAMATTSLVPMGTRWSQINEAARRYLEARRAGVRPISMTRAQPGYGYRRDEMTVPDDWPDPYYGKMYDGTYATTSNELLTTAAQDVFFNTGRIERDPETKNWILGVLAAL